MHPYFTAIASFVVAGRAYELSCRQLAEAKAELAMYKRQVVVAYPTQSTEHQREREAYCAPSLSRVQARIASYDVAKAQELAAYQAAEAAHATEQAETLVFVLAE